MAGGLTVELSDIYTDARSSLQCASLLLVTMRDPNDAVFAELQSRNGQWGSSGVKSVQVLGDAHAPGSVAAAVYAGHKAARALDMAELPLHAIPFKRETIALEAPPGSSSE
jgi:dimethylamine/trimethylamine dehydrogenase